MLIKLLLFEAIKPNVFAVIVRADSSRAFRGLGWETLY